MREPEIAKAMIAALRSEFGPLPDQSMHEKTSVPALIEEIYTFLRQADRLALVTIAAPAASLLSVGRVGAATVAIECEGSIDIPAINLHFGVDGRAGVRRRLHLHRGDDVTRGVTKHLLALAGVFGGDD